MAGIPSADEIEAAKAALQANLPPQAKKQEELAKKAKVSRGNLAALEAGYKKNPSLLVLKLLAKALGVPVTELLE